MNGHTIERGTDGVFRSSGIFQEVAWNSPRKDGPAFVRSGVKNPKLKGSSPTAYLAGQELVVEAFGNMMRSANANEATYQVEIIGGRPGYLNGMALELNEAIVALRELKETFGPDFNAKTVSHTKTTADEMVYLLDLADKEETEEIRLVMLQFRIPRAEVLLSLTAIKVGKVKALAKIMLVPAEEHISKRSLAKVRRAYASPAYQATMCQEMTGMRKALVGSYGRGGNT